MSKKKKKKSDRGQPKRKIRISQCMIVKNEEKNIERALGWAKDIAFEQIVVDTGSTDRTVEIAERMGAKVYSFEWIDDFAAAKNFAIEQASGDWIAFLDADEYFSAEDARELVVLLREIEDCPTPLKYQAVTCSWVQLGDEGEVFAALKQERVFRNEPGLRYEGRIHEHLTTTRYNIEDLELRIMHDGYSKTVYTDADKGSRNRKLLLEELEREPDNAAMMIYLANSYKADMTKEGDKEAESLFRKALDIGSEISPMVKKLAYDFLIPYYMRNESGYNDARRFCDEALDLYPEFLDFYYYSGKLKNSAGDYDGAMSDLRECERIMKSTSVPLTNILLEDTSPLQKQLEISARGLVGAKSADKHIEPVNGENSKIRLSQCMIVKNEERNIERALGWARDIAFEQIVVDTGSTDRTVEIAESLGAKVYHFEWIDDFAAAKNYAIEQASGDWIAFLDADEYFEDGDAEKLAVYLAELGDNPKKTDVQAITCPMLQLNDEKEAYAVYMKDRVFRNVPEIRYKGRVHESLTLTRETVKNKELRIMHTGYADSVFKEAGKSERNIKLLRRELEEDPENPEMMIYLADSIKSTRQPEDKAEAAGIYNEALRSNRAIHSDLKRFAYDFLINYYIEDTQQIAEAEELCACALKEYPELMDYLYYDAVLKNMRGDYKNAWDSLAKCEKALDGSANPPTRFLLKNRLPLFFQRVLAAQGLGDLENVIKYATLILEQEKNSKEILVPYIAVLKQNNIDDGDIIGLLRKLYDFTSITDKLFIVRAAKDADAISLAQIVLAMITDKERRWLSGEG